MCDPRNSVPSPLGKFYGNFVSLKSQNNKGIVNCFLRKRFFVCPDDQGLSFPIFHPQVRAHPRVSASFFKMKVSYYNHPDTLNCTSYVFTIIQGPPSQSVTLNCTSYVFTIINIFKGQLIWLN